MQDSFCVAIIDLDTWEKKSLAANRVIRLQHECYSFCWLGESHSTGYLMAADYPSNHDTNLYIYRVNLDSVKEGEVMTVTRQVDLGLTRLAIYPTSGEVVLVEGQIKADEGKQEQNAFITLNL